MAWRTTNIAAPVPGPASDTASGGLAGSNGIVQHQGTEYTLQGVMRFLQTEWHRHERDRNAWQIERQEMRGQIARLQGELRTARKLRESMDKHVRMLETALRRKNQASPATDAVRPATESKASGDSLRPNQESKSPTRPISKGHNSFLDVEDGHGTTPFDDHDRDRSRSYLAKCLEEITYHIMTAPSDQQMPDSSSENHHHESKPPSLPPHPSAQLSLSDIYAQPPGARGANPALTPDSNYLPLERPRLPELAQPRRTNDQTLARAIPGDMNGVQDPQERYWNNIENEALTFDPESFDRSAVLPLRTQSSRSESEMLNDQMSADLGHRTASPPNSHESGLIRGNEEASMNNWDFAAAGAPYSGINNQSSNSITREFPAHPSSSIMQDTDSHALEMSNERQNFLSSAQPLGSFNLRYALRGHLDVVRTALFTHNGNAASHEICTAGDDGTIKRWLLMDHGQQLYDDFDIKCQQTHRGHDGAVLCLASQTYGSWTTKNSHQTYSEPWLFSGGQDSTIKVWDRSRVDARATLQGHSDAVWALCVLPSPGIWTGTEDDHNAQDSTKCNILVSGSADGTVIIWSVAQPPLSASSITKSRRAMGTGRRANSISSGSGFSAPIAVSGVSDTTAPQHCLIRRIEPRRGRPSPVTICSLDPVLSTFVVSYSDGTICTFDAQKQNVIHELEADGGADELTVANTITTGSRCLELAELIEEERKHTPLWYANSGGILISGHEDRYIKIRDADSLQCIQSILAHPGPVSSICLSPFGRELVSGGSDGSLRFWDLGSKNCTQEISSHRLMRDEGICCVDWSADGRWIVSAGGDGVVKVFSRSSDAQISNGDESFRSAVGGELDGNKTHPSNASDDDEDGWRF